MTSSPRTPKVIRFGTFEAYVAGVQLRNHGQPVKIQDQPFQVLAALLERPGEIVTREELRQRIWPQDVYVNFEHSLRTSILKLREVLGDSADHPRFVETVPRHGYRFICPLETRDGPMATRKSPWSRVVPWLATMLFLAAIGAAWHYANVAGGPKLLPAPLTSLAGPEWLPAISPDGRLVAFSWGAMGDSRGPPGISALYVQRIGDEKPIRLTDAAAYDFSPAWSPDSLRIAFCRCASGGNSTIHVIDAWGGGERMLGQSSACLEPWLLRRVAWSQDGEFLAVAERSSSQEPEGIVLLSIRTGEKRKLTMPPSQADMDHGPAFSPDGRTLAFVRTRISGMGLSGIYLLTLDTSNSPSGQPKRLISEEEMIHGLDWTPDGGSIVFSSTGAGGMYHLWRIPVAGGKRRQLSAGENAYYPSLSRKGKRLVFGRRLVDANIWRIARADSSVGGRDTAMKLIDSTRMDHSPRYSPDGGKVAFVSSRTGAAEIYVCDRDGAGQQKLTSLGGSGKPNWSPNGLFITFQASSGGNEDIYAVSANGGRLRRLTQHASGNVCPSWSSNGKWVYFGSDRSGTWQIWKTPSEGGLAEQVTKHGGYEAYEPEGSASLFYTKRPFAAEIWKVPLAGGDETQVIGGMPHTHWALLKSGICLITRGPESETSLKFFRFATGRIEDFAKLPKRALLHDGLAVSPDERWILYSRVDTFESDVMLIDNFR